MELENYWIIPGIKEPDETFISRVFKSIEDVLGFSCLVNSRKKRVSEGRFLASYIIKKYIGLSDEEIASLIHKDRCTVIYAYKVIDSVLSFCNNDFYYYWQHVLNEFGIKPKKMASKKITKDDIPKTCGMCVNFDILGQKCKKRNTFCYDGKPVPSCCINFDYCKKK